MLLNTAEGNLFLLAFYESIFFSCHRLFVSCHISFTVKLPARWSQKNETRNTRKRWWVVKYDISLHQGRTFLIHQRNAAVILLTEFSWNANPKWLVINPVFKFLRRRVNGKHAMRVQSEPFFFQILPVQCVRVYMASVDWAWPKLRVGNVFKESFLLL